jgi:hypothetical protein
MWGSGEGEVTADLEGIEFEIGEHALVDLAMHFE